MRSLDWLLVTLVAVPASAQCPPATLTPIDAQSGEHLGRSVAIDGELAVLGAWRYDRPGQPYFWNGGGAVVFERQTGSWSPVARLFHTPAGMPYESELNARAGWSVAISGTHVLVGAPEYTLTQGTHGVVFAWTRSGSVWAEEPLLRATDEDVFQFGWSVALQGDEALVGHPNGHAPFGSTTLRPGKLWRFARTPTQWVPSGNVWSSDATTMARFGESVAVDGDRLIVGAPRDTGLIADCGAAYVFEKSGVMWVQVAKLVSPFPATGDEFGTSVSIHGDVAVVGAWLADAPGGLADAGAVHVFRRTPSATWEHSALAWGERAGAQLGCSVAVSSTKVVCGARRDPLHAPEAGTASLCDLVGGTLANRRGLLSPDASGYDQFGISVALAEDVAIVGAIREGFALGEASQVGAGYVYADGGTDADADQVPDACTNSIGTALCFGDGSGTACPCGNESSPAERAGCRHSFGRGGALTADGVASLAADTVVLTAAWLPANVATLFFQGTGFLGGGAGTVFGDGLRCAGGVTKRIGRPFADPNGVARFGAGVAGTDLVSLAGTIPAAGGTRVYQVWFRNAAAFCSGATFNLSNGLRLIWTP